MKQLLGIMKAMGWRTNLGIIAIVLLILVSVGGAYLRPDKTPLANQQFHALARLKPLARVDFLKIRKTEAVVETPWYAKFFLGGEEPAYALIPYHEIEFESSGVRLNLLSPLGIEGHHFFTYAEVLPEVSDTREAAEKIRAECLTSRVFLLGTDPFGRDLLSRLMAGGIVTITIALLSVAVAVFVGLVVGLVSGYIGGVVDKMLGWVVNVFWSVPSVLLVIAVALLVGQSALGVMVGMGLVLWVEIAQVVRGEVLQLREREFVSAARLMGLSDVRIIWRHIFPNLRKTVAVIAVSNFSEAVLMESGMSFLGIGVQPPAPSWGNMLRESYGYIITGSAHMAIFPALAIVALVLSFSAIGHGIGKAPLERVRPA